MKPEVISARIATALFLNGGLWASIVEPQTRLQSIRFLKRSAQNLGRGGPFIGRAGKGIYINTTHHDERLEYGFDFDSSCGAGRVRALHTLANDAGTGRAVFLSFLVIERYCGDQYLRFAPRCAKVFAGNS